MFLLSLIEENLAFLKFYRNFFETAEPTHRIWNIIVTFFMNEFSSFKDFCCKYSFDNCRIAVQDILSQNYPFPFLSAILPDLSTFSFIFRKWRWSFKNTSCLKILSSRRALSKCPPRKYVFCSLSDTFPQTLVRFEENSFFPWIC